MHAQFLSFHRGLTRCLSKIDLLNLLDISLGLSRGCRKCQGNKVYPVASSKFYESLVQRVYPELAVDHTFNWNRGLEAIQVGCLKWRPPLTSLSLFWVLWPANQVGLQKQLSYHPYPSYGGLGWVVGSLDHSHDQSSTSTQSPTWQCMTNPAMSQQCKIDSFTPNNLIKFDFH